MDETRLTLALHRISTEMAYIREAPTYELRWTAESEAALKQAEEVLRQAPQAESAPSADTEAQ